jgi:hypothetical protein
MTDHGRTMAIVLDMANRLSLPNLNAIVDDICKDFTDIQKKEATIRIEDHEAPDMHVTRLCDPLPADTLKPIIAHMAALLTHADLKDVLLTAIPVRKLRWLQPGKPEARKGVRQPPRWPLPVQLPLYTAEVCKQFPEIDDLEYLEYIHNVVLAQDPIKDASNLEFLLEDFDMLLTKVEGIPSYFQPILIIFHQWHKLTPPPHVPQATHMEVEAQMSVLLAKLQEQR